MNCITLNINYYLEKLYETLLQPKIYFCVENDQVVAKTLNIVQRIFRRMGWYADTRKAYVLRQIYPLVLQSNSIPCEHKVRIRNWLRADVDEFKRSSHFTFQVMVDNKKNIEWNGNLVSIDVWVGYEELARASYVDRQNNEIFSGPAEEGISVTINFSCDCLSLSQASIQITRMDNNNFALRSTAEEPLEPVLNEKERAFKQWYFNQIKEFAHDINRDLREQAPNIYLMSRHQYSENFCNMLGVGFNTQLLTSRQGQFFNLYKFTNFQESSAEKVNDLSLAFSLGYEENPNSVHMKSARKVSESQ